MVSIALFDPYVASVIHLLSFLVTTTTTTATTGLTADGFIVDRFFEGGKRRLYYISYIYHTCIMHIIYTY